MSDTAPPSLLPRCPGLRTFAERDTHRATTAASHLSRRLGLRVAVVAVATALVAVACTSGPEEATPQTTIATTTSTTVPADVSGGSLRVGLPEPAGITSPTVEGLSGLEITDLLFDGLTSLGPDGRAVPAVAESWETDDGAIWNFHLRPDAVFENGEPVTAQSFVDAFTRLADPRTSAPLAPLGGYVLGITGWGAPTEPGRPPRLGVAAADPTTLRIVLDRPFSLLPEALAHPVFSPVASADVAPEGRSTPIGNGPYRLAEPWTPGSGLVLERSPTYTGTRPPVGRLEIIPVDPVEATAALDRSELDIALVRAGSVPAPGSSWAPVTASGPDSVFLEFPIGVPPTDQVDLRAALVLAVDRQALAATVDSDVYEPLDRFIASPLHGSAESACETCRSDPEEALARWQALEEPPDSLRLYHVDSPRSAALARFLADQWAELPGVPVETVPMDLQALVEALGDGAVDGPFILDWAWDAPTVLDVLGPLLRTGSADNFTGLADSDLDAALVDARGSLDPAEQSRAITAATARVDELVPLTPLLSRRVTWGVAESVAGATLDPYGSVRLYSVSVP